jgi:hypothetical protein
MFDAWRMRFEDFIREIRGKVFWEGESVERWIMAPAQAATIVMMTAIVPPEFSIVHVPSPLRILRDNSP